MCTKVRCISWLAVAFRHVGGQTRKWELSAPYSVLYASPCSARSVDHVQSTEDYRHIAEAHCFSHRSHLLALYRDCT